MFKIRLIPCLGLLLAMLACSSENEESTGYQADPMTQPMHYETNQEQKDRLHADKPSIGEQGGYPQSEQKQVNNADDQREYSDAFTNEEAKLLSNELQNTKDIVQAQVAVTDTRIIIGVMLREHIDHHAAKRIESTVRDILPNTDKDIIVYTDDTHWDRMKNLDARLKARNMGDNLEKAVEDFLNITD